MEHPLLAPEGEQQLLLGNEAIVRGALEAIDKNEEFIKMTVCIFYTERYFA